MAGRRRRMTAGTAMAAATARWPPLHGVPARSSLPTDPQGLLTAPPDSKETLPRGNPPEAQRKQRMSFGQRLGPRSQTRRTACGQCGGATVSRARAAAAGSKAAGKRKPLQTVSPLNFIPAYGWIAAGCC